MKISREKMIKMEFTSADEYVKIVRKPALKVKAASNKKDKTPARSGCQGERKKEENRSIEIPATRHRQGACTCLPDEERKLP